MCIVGLFPFSAWPQQNQAMSKEAEIDPLSYAIEVELAQISVRVTDKDGKWVSGLTKEDLEISEDGIPQEIRFVDEIVATTEQAALPSHNVAPEKKEFTVSSIFPNSIIILFDTTSSGQIGIETHKKYIEDFLRNFDVPNTIFSLIVIKPTGDYEISQNFTDDKSLLLEALDHVRGSTAGIQDKIFKTGQLSDTNMIKQCTVARSPTYQDACFDQALGGLVRKANGFAQEEQNRASNAIRSMKKIFALADHVPGRKGILLVSEGIDPGGSYYYNYGANMIRHWMEQYGVPQRYESFISDMRVEASRSISKNLEVGELVKSANASGLTIYWANPQYGKSATDSSAELGMMTSLNFKLTNAPDVDFTMRGMAEDTGGEALSSTNPTEFYNRLKERIPRYYLINYKPKRLMNDGKFHRVEVHAKKKDYHVSYAKDFKDWDLRERIKTRLAGALDFPAVSSQFPAELMVNYFKRSTGDYQVIIHSGISYQDIAPQIIENRFADDIHFSFLVRDGEGNVIQNTHPILKIRTSPEEFQTFQEKEASLEYVQNYNLKPGSYQISLAVMDVTGWRTGANASFIKLPGAAESCLSISPPLLASAITQSVNTSKDPMPTENGEILYGDRLFNFSSQRFFPPKGNLTGFYQIYNAREKQESSNPSILVFFGLYRDKTVFVNKTPDHKITAFTDPMQKLISNFYSVPYNNLPPGSYELAIEARDDVNGCKASTRVPFVIVAPPAETTSK
jgi:VWFA-related protein